KRGAVITKINGNISPAIVDTMFNYISSDGYNQTHKYQTLSNRCYFGALYTSLYGISEKYTIEYKDSTGITKTITIPVYNPATDTPTRRVGPRLIKNIPPQPSKKEIKEQQLNNSRLLRIDSVNHTAMMTLSTFIKGYGLKKFFRNSFRALQKNKIGHLIIDVRGNGGGSVGNSTLISRYMAKQSFKIGDSLYAVQKRGTHDKYIQNHFWNRLFISLLTKKRSDGNYHFGYFERHQFKPKKQNHFDGKVYIVTGGNSFSATTLFTSYLIKQENVIVVGEETGGGSYGNSAWLIPDVTLPETGIRFRLPLFRLVIDKNAPKTGRGILPQVESKPTIEAIIRNADFKVEKVMELINKDKKPL
ncbi:MAG: S41 family peptidase, partial [Chitinophagaceae bacterium]